MRSRSRRFARWPSNSKRCPTTLVTAPPADFSPEDTTATLAGTIEINNQRHEKRVLRSVEVSAEDISLPLARQAALVRRETSGRKVEVVALVRSLPPTELDATVWLQANRQHLGIENRLHHRLDASHNDDGCRVRARQSRRFMGIGRRFSHSLFCYWRQQFKKPHPKTTTDFFDAMGVEHCTPAIHTLNAAKPGIIKRL